MQKCNHIKAHLFLGIFSMLLLYQVIPHLHHQHEVEHTHKDMAHSHNHHHHTPEKESSKKGFFDLFLDMHVHSLVNSDILLTYENGIEQLKVKNNVSSSKAIAHYTLVENYDEVERRTVYHPPNNYFNTYLTSLNLRGPPTLG